VIGYVEAYPRFAKLRELWDADTEFYCFEHWEWSAADSVNSIVWPRYRMEDIRAQLIEELKIRVAR
jgi:hypothetical protein